MKTKLKLHRSILYNQLPNEFTSAIRTSEINFSSFLLTYLFIYKGLPSPNPENNEDTSALAELSGYYGERISSLTTALLLLDQSCSAASKQFLATKLLGKASGIKMGLSFLIIEPTAYHNEAQWMGL